MIPSQTDTESGMMNRARRPDSDVPPSSPPRSGNRAKRSPKANARHPSESVKEKTLSWLIPEMVKKLVPREVAILHERFGLNGNPKKNLDEVGEKLGVTREEARQIQNNALAKLRAI